VRVPRQISFTIDKHRLILFRTTQGIFYFIYFYFTFI
jgi:hypothetical protein